MINAPRSGANGLCNAWPSAVAANATTAAAATAVYSVGLFVRVFQR
jgi:hypothetical protein